jgi:drug/metabolite transporter (DMT)-like permease
MSRIAFSSAAVGALVAALLFGASTPLAKQLLRDTSPVMLAGLLYLGSGIGLGVIRTTRDRGWRAPAMSRREWSWYLLAIGFGGVLGPLLLMLGLTRTSAAPASLLLNLEAVLTALLAWIVFRENANRRVISGMVLIVAGAVLLAWPGEPNQGRLGCGAGLIARLPVLGAGQQLHPQSVGLGRAVHRGAQGHRGWRGQHRHRVAARRAFSRRDRHR